MEDLAAAAAAAMKAPESLVVRSARARAAADGLEVETVLAAEQHLGEREDHLAVAAEQSRAAERLAAERYRSGLEDFITVLESQRRALQADGEWIAARRQRLENRVDLYLALGGGFERSQTALQMEGEEASPGEKETEK